MHHVSLLCAHTAFASSRRPGHGVPIALAAPKRRPPCNAALLQFRRLQFACDPRLCVRHPHWIDGRALNASEFATAGLHDYEMHRLLALRAVGRRGIFGHVTLTLDQAGAQHSQSPVLPRIGAVITYSAPFVLTKASRFRTANRDGTLTYRLVLDVETGRRVPENEIGHQSGYTRLRR